MDRSFLLVERYDRLIDAQGHRQRLHQEDFCQTLGVVPEMKYQNEGGPDLAQCFDRVRSATRPNAPQEVVLARYEHRATIFTSNLTFAEWGGLLGDEVLATALLDRVLHHAEVIAINGRSYRMRERAASDRPTATP